MQNVSLQNQLQSRKISLSCPIYLLVHNTVEIRVKKKMEWSTICQDFILHEKHQDRVANRSSEVPVDSHELLCNLLQLTACCSSDGGDRVMCK
jgi:hypothetical protein